MELLRDTGQDAEIVEFCKNTRIFSGKLKG